MVKESLFGNILKLPEKFLLALLAFIALFVVSLIATWFPAIGNWFWGAGLILVAIFLPPVDLLKSKKYTLTLGSIAALLGIGILVLNILAINFASFSFTVVQAVSVPTAQSIAAQSTSLSGELPLGLDMGTFALAIAASVVGAIIAQKYILKKRK